MVAVLERLKAAGLPQTIKVDNGSEFISKALDAWAHRHGSRGQQTPSAFVADWQQTRTDPKAEFLTHEMVQYSGRCQSLKYLVMSGPKQRRVTSELEFEISKPGQLVFNTSLLDSTQRSVSL